MHACVGPLFFRFYPCSGLCGTVWIFHPGFLIRDRVAADLNHRLCRNRLVHDDRHWFLQLSLLNRLLLNYRRRLSFHHHLLWSCRLLHHGFRFGDRNRCRNLFHQHNSVDLLDVEDGAGTHVDDIADTVGTKAEDGTEPTDFFTGLDDRRFVSIELQHDLVVLPSAAHLYESRGETARKTITRHLGPLGIAIDLHNLVGTVRYGAATNQTRDHDRHYCNCRHINELHISPFR